MIIGQEVQQLSPIAVKTLLKLGVREPRRVGPVQKANQYLERLTARHQSRHGSAITRREAAGAHGCSISTNLTVRQEFPARRVKFATTRVEIGSQVGHLRGRRCT